jgi:hypothetical protein
MNLSLVSFADSGNLERERVVLKVTGDDDVGTYIALCSESGEPRIASSGKNLAFWFPETAVKEGDIVVLYTKSGEESKKDIGDGHTAYFFYWGLPNPVWGTSDMALVLIETNEYTVEWSGETREPEAP